MQQHNSSEVAGSGSSYSPQFPVQSRDHAPAMQNPAAGPLLNRLDANSSGELPQEWQGEGDAPFV